MFYNELFECVPLKVDDKWMIVEQNKTYSGFKGWLDYIALEEGKFADYLLRLNEHTRQLYIDNTINRLLEAFNQSYKAEEETGNKDVYEVLLAFKGALECIRFRFKDLKFACSTDIVNRWSDKFPFMKDFPVLEASTDEIQETRFTLPIDLDTNRARKYIGKAIEIGLIKAVDNGIRWTITKKGGKVRLAYFLFRVYCQDDNNKDNGLLFPETALDTLFMQSRLGHSLSQIANNKKHGYPEIDELFE